MKFDDKEIKLITKLLKTGKSLPEKYRLRLFKNTKDEEFIWEGKSKYIFQSKSSFKKIETISNTKLNKINSNKRAENTLNSNNWKNKLILGDNKYIMSSLKEEPFKTNITENGGIKLIYIDPPFDVGTNFKINNSYSKNIRDVEVKKEAIAYTDKWGKGNESYLNMIHERLLLMREILSLDGSIFIHCDYRTSSKIRMLLDEIFGIDSFVNEIIWCYRQGGRASVSYGKKHDNIFWFSRSNKRIFNPDNVRIPYDGLGGYQTSGNGVKIKGKTYKPNILGKIPEDWWDIPAIPPMSQERVGYPTQKPEELLKRIILGSSNPGDIVCDFFSGSGTTAAVCEKFGRKWICSDLSKIAIQISRERLIQNKLDLNNQNKKHLPFELLKIDN